MISSLITWDNLGDIIATVLAIWGALALVLGILIGRSIAWARGPEPEAPAVECQFCGGPHDGATTLCTDDLEESSVQG